MRRRRKWLIVIGAVVACLCAAVAYLWLTGGQDRALGRVAHAVHVDQDVELAADDLIRYFSTKGIPQEKGSVWEVDYEDFLELAKRQKNLRASKSVCEAAVRVFPDRYLTQFNYGVVLYDLGEYAGAAASFAKCKELEPEPLVLRWNSVTIDGQIYDKPSRRFRPLMEEADIAHYFAEHYEQKAKARALGVSPDVPGL